MTRPAFSRFFDGTRFPFSFRQLLLIAFLGIILLLGGALTRTLASKPDATIQHRFTPIFC